VIADLSINHVERFVLRCGWTVHRMNPDYGIDLVMQVFKADGQLENGEVKFQVRATYALPRLARRRAIPSRLDARDAIYWLNDAMPVILVIYDARADRAWWLCLQEALRDKQQKMKASLTVHIPLDQVVNETAIRHIASLREHVRKEV
jgi:hypothetical protein